MDLLLCDASSVLDRLRKERRSELEIPDIIVLEIFFILLLIETFFCFLYQNCIHTLFTESLFCSSKPLQYSSDGGVTQRFDVIYLAEYFTIIFG